MCKSLVVFAFLVLAGLWSACPSSAGLPPSPTKGDTWVEPTTGLEFVWIEGGCFWMGQTDEEKSNLIKSFGLSTFKRHFSDELPRHEVCVDGFWMGKYEVINAQYRKFRPDHDSGNAVVGYNVLDGIITRVTGDSPGRGPSLNGDRQPVVRVNWTDAMVFAQWLSEKTGKNIRLPTEAEWEYAARAGTTTAYFWGDDPEEACRYGNVNDKTTADALESRGVGFSCKDGYGVLAPVGSFEANPWGLHDMVGNASEWCFDWYASDYYGRSPKNNPREPQKMDYRVKRGGGLVTTRHENVRSARRGKSSDHISSNLGFRLIMSASQKESRKQVSK